MTKIFGYIISNPDENPVLPDALDSLASFCDRIFLVDGGLGGGTLNHHPEHTEPIYEWLSARLEVNTERITPSLMVFTTKSQPPSEEELERLKKALTGIGKERPVILPDDIKLEYYPPNEASADWNGVPLTLWIHPFTDPAAQRNWTLNKIWDESEQCDWLVMLDSDEVYSYEAERGMRDYLAQVPDNIIGITQKWLNLVQDEQNCVGGHHSDWLAHPRILRPRTFSFSGSWHEHLVCDRSKLLQWDTRIVHSRALFRRRLLVQRGHATIKERSRVNPALGPFWDDAVMESIPEGITWRPLNWPEGEVVLPFDKDALEVWTESGELKR